MKQHILPNVEFRTTDGIFIKQMAMKVAGTIVPQHAHCWDHTSLLARGSVNCWKDGVFDGKYDAPQMILIRAGVKHLFMSLEDNTILYCIHNLHSEDKIEILAEHSLDEYELTE
jgi:quercetin dioxygenase-like cupin family protein